VDSNKERPRFSDNGCTTGEDGKLLSIPPNPLQIQLSLALFGSLRRFQLVQTPSLALPSSSVSLQSITEFIIAVEDFAIHLPR
jgi:hypothetical protein